MQTLLKTTGAYQLLKNEGKNKDFSHAYLLLFDDARNLRTALKTFAKLFFGCENEYTEKARRISELIDAENYTDCLFYPDEEGKKLLVDDADKILEESALAPVEGGKKVFLLGDFSTANAPTQNKLLKLLEEPPQGVIFLLGATTSFSILQTVLSRTKKLEILSFDTPSITEYLRRSYGDKYDENTLELCAATANGNVGDACNILEGGYYKELTDNAFSLILSPLHKLPAVVKQVGETPRKKELLNLLRLIFRDALLFKTGLKKNIVLKTEKERISAVADTFSSSALLYAQEAISIAEKQVTFNAVFSQCIEICLANIHNQNK
jgi:DNA polymerase III gamma/tau subunit